MKHKAQILSAVMIVLLLAAVPLQITTSQSAAQTTTDQQTQRTVSVSGTGQVSAQPDVAKVTIGVETQATEAAAALSQNNTQMSAVVDALEKAGVAAADIQTQVVQLQPQYEQPPVSATVPMTTTVPKLVGYIATNLVQVTVKKLDTLGSLLDTAVQAGGNRIENISFEVSDPAAALQQARQAAWNDALQKAQQLAQLAGVQLGDVLSINESSVGPQPIFARAASTGSAVPIQPGTQTIEVDLQVTWLLQ
jgi:uncharacterized protein YggE